MPNDAKRSTAAKVVKDAQRKFERDSKTARVARRKAFAQAQKEGLSLRDIGELVGLDRAGDLKRREKLPDTEKAKREAAAFGRLLVALDVGTISLPDEEAREAVEAMDLSIEGDANYARVIVEHDALFGLLSLLGGTEVEAR